MKTLPQQVKELSTFSFVFLPITILFLVGSIIHLNGKINALNSLSTAVYNEALDENHNVSYEMTSRISEIANMTNRVATLEDHLGLTFVESSSEDVPAHYIKTKDVQGKLKRFLTDGIDLPRCILGTNCSFWSDATITKSKVYIGGEER